MPGRLYLETPLSDIGRWIGVGVGGIAEPGPRRNIQPGQEVICLTAIGFQPMRWGIIPVGRVNARGRPVMETIINARSETVFDKSAFDGVGRAVVIVDGWYEWTGEKRRKTAWRIFGADRPGVSGHALGHHPGGAQKRARASGDGNDHQCALGNRL